MPCWMMMEGVFEVSEGLGQLRQWTKRGCCKSLEETKEERRDGFFVCTRDKAVCLHCDMVILDGGRLGGWTV